MNNSHTFKLLDFLDEGVLLINSEFHICFWNKRLEQWSGIQRENILGDHIFDRFPHLRESQRKNRIHTLMAGGAPVVFSSQLHQYFIPCSLPNGEFRMQQTTASRLNDEYANMIMFCIQDQTEHSIRLKSLKDTKSKLEHELAEHARMERHNTRLTTAIDQASEAVIILDLKGNIQYINQIFSQQTGLSLSDTQDHADWFDDQHDNEISLLQLLKHTVEKNTTWQGIRNIKHQNGSSLTASVSMTPIINNDGCITHITMIQEDISERMSLEEKHRRTQKNEALITLIGGIAHDFNNILSGILGQVYLASRAAKEIPKVTQRMQKIQTAVYEAADIVKQLLSFSRNSQLSTQNFPLDSFLKEWIKLIEHSIPEHTALHLDFDHNKYPLHADADMLQQSMFNLVRNACEATDDQQNGIITINLRVFDALKNPGLLNLYPQLAEEDFAHIMIHDNGKGIKAENIGRVCDPFFTTKQMGKGLGLAHVTGCISQHHGFLEIESVPGSTTFHLLLPLSHVEAVAQASTHVSDELSARVLVVDDDLNVQEVCAELLIERGHQVITASDGKEALQQFKQHADHIDIIIMDVLMPQMNGILAAKAIRKIRSDIPIVFSTSYDKSIATHEVDKMEHAILISKPFDPDYLQELLIKFVQKG